MLPDPPIEAYVFGSRLGKRSVFILDLCLGHSPVAGYSDFRLCAQNNTSLTYHPSTVG